MRNEKLFGIMTLLYKTRLRHVNHLAIQKARIYSPLGKFGFVEYEKPFRIDKVLDYIEAWMMRR